MLKNVSLYPIFIVLNLFAVFSVMGSNAPTVTINAVKNAVPGEQITIPIFVSNFDSIAGFTLSLDYDYHKLEFVSGTQNPNLGGTCKIGDIALKNGFHRLTIAWYKLSSSGVNLPDSSILVDYVFKYISGVSLLSWYDMGPSCEFSDPKANSLNDTPVSKYYLGGIIADSSSVINGAIDSTFIRTDIVNKDEAQSLKFYCNNRKQLVVDGANEANLIIRLYNLNGKLILLKKIGANLRTIIQLPNLNTGIYIVHLEDKSMVKSGKIFINE